MSVKINDEGSMINFDQLPLVGEDFENLQREHRVTDVAQNAIEREKADDNSDDERSVLKNAPVVVLEFDATETHSGAASIDRDFTTPKAKERKKTDDNSDDEGSALEDTPVGVFESDDVETHSGAASSSKVRNNESDQSAKASRGICFSYVAFFALSYFASVILKGNLFAARSYREDTYQQLAWECQFGLGNQFEVMLDSQCPATVLSPLVLEQIDEGQMDVDAKSAHRELTPLGCASIGNCDVNVVSELIAKGALFNKVDKDFNSALHHTLRDDAKEECSLFLLRDPDVLMGAENNKGVTLLHRAAQYNRLESARILSSQKFLLDRLNPHDKRSALDIALHKNHRDFARLLIENGASPENSVDPEQVKEIQQEIEIDRIFYQRVKIAGTIALLTIAGAAVSAYRKKAQAKAEKPSSKPATVAKPMSPSLRTAASGNRQN